MTIRQENIEESFSVFFNIINSVSTFFSYLLSKINNAASIFEIGIVISIAFFSYVFQKWVQHRYRAEITHKENPSWSQWLLHAALSFVAPFITFVLLTFAMSISEHFTQNLETYRLSIKLTLIWFIWIFTLRMIVDPFVRWIVSCTIIPLLIFSSFGLANPVINYLDSLAFSLGDIQVSIFSMLKGLLIATCLFWCARILCRSVNSFIESQKKINPEIRDLMQNVFQVVLYITAILITVDLAGIDLKSLAIVGGAVGIGIGLGLQRIAANFISGIIILFEQNVKVGHLVEIPGGGGPGWIRHLGARAVVIDTGDGRELLIPNEELLTKNLIDWTSKDTKVRIDLQVKVSFRSNLEKAKEIMLEAILAHPICSKSLPPFCYLEKFTDNGAQFLLQFWVDDVSVGKMDIQNDVLLTIWKRFAQESIDLASPLNLNHYINEQA